MRSSFLASPSVLLSTGFRKRELTLEKVPAVLAARLYAHLMRLLAARIQLASAMRVHSVTVVLVGGGGVHEEIIVSLRFAHMLSHLCTVQLHRLLNVNEGLLKARTSSRKMKRVLCSFTHSKNRLMGSGGSRPCLTRY